MQKLSPNREVCNGAKQDYIASAWALSWCPQGTSPGRETCVSLLWKRTTGDGIECSWPDAGMSLSEIQVLEIRSMMTAGIRAASSLFS